MLPFLWRQRPFTTAKGIQKSSLYVSAGHTAHSQVNSGIQRVTRSIAKEVLRRYKDSDLLEWGYTDDPDGNGLNNLFEYSAGNLPDYSVNGDSYSYFYNRRRDAGARGLTYQLERSDNLVSNVWNPIEFSGTTEILNESFEAVTQTGSVSSLTQEFIRLKIELDE